MSMNASFIAFVGDEVTRALLSRIASEKGWEGAEIHPGGLAAASEILARMATPKLIVIDISETGTSPAAPVSDIAALASVCDPGTRVIALGAVNDVDIYRRLMAIGVDDYLVKPVAEESLTAALEKAFASAKLEQTAKPRPCARMIAVTNACGGGGASMVAANTAWIMAHELGLKTALVDLDLYFGTAALSLDLEPGRGFREALENPDRIDALFIERAMVRESENLFVLAAEEPLDTSFSFDHRSLDLLLNHLSEDFDCVVLDIPRFAARTQLDCNDALTAVVVVAEPSLTGMRDAGRLKKLSMNSAPGADLRIVLNRLGAFKGSELSKDDFERGGNLSVHYAMPFDAKSMSLAAAAGRVVAEVAPGSKITGQLRSLAGDLSGREDEENKAPFWRRLGAVGASLGFFLTKTKAA